MAKRRATTPGLPDAVRDAVDRTVKATVGTRDRAQEAVDEVVGGLEAGRKAVTERVRGAIDERRPVTQEDVRELRAELRVIARRLEAIEERLPAKRAAKRSPSTTAKRSSPKTNK
jgi:hypothetical protein